MLGLPRNTGKVQTHGGSTLALPFRPNPNQEAAAAAREQEATQAAAASLEATQRLRTAMGSGRLALT